MKKNAFIVTAATVALASCIALPACSSGETESTPEATTEPVAAEQQEPEAAESSYAATIDAMTVGTDYEGKPAIIVTYSWTNNSDDAMSAAAALSMKCFQNGVQLETGIVTSDIDSDGYMAEVKPGAGTSFQLAYLLDDETDVTVEVSELISFSDDLLAEQTFSVA